MANTTLTMNAVSMKDLTDKRKAFVMSYLTDFNGSKAAREAGFAPPYERAAIDVLRSKKVQYAIGRILANRCNKHELRAEAILEELFFCVHQDPIDFVDENGQVISNLRNIPERARKTIDSIKQRSYFNADGVLTHIDSEFRLVPKLPSIELGLKHLGIANASPAQGDGGPSIDWKKLSGAHRKITEDPLENRIAEVAKSDATAIEARQLRE